jgi:hypothetical protein
MNSRLPLVEEVERGIVFLMQMREAEGRALTYFFCDLDMAGIVPSTSHIIFQAALHD